MDYTRIIPFSASVGEMFRQMDKAMRCYMAYQMEYLQDAVPKKIGNVTPVEKSIYGAYVPRCLMDFSDEKLANEIYEELHKDVMVMAELKFIRNRINDILEAAEKGER